LGPLYEDESVQGFSALEDMMVEAGKAGTKSANIQFLQLSKNTCGYDRLALSIQARHHLILHFQLVTHCVRKKIGIDEDAIRGLQSSIILEE
jgi:hypothetical protein